METEAAFWPVFHNSLWEILEMREKCFKNKLLWIEMVVHGIFDLEETHSNGRYSMSRDEGGRWGKKTTYSISKSEFFFAYFHFFFPFQKP